MITWLVLSTALCAVTSIAVWSRRPTMARGLAVIAMLAVIPLSGVLLFSQRGWARPVVPYLSQFPDGELQVDGVRLVPEVAIFLMLSDGGEPRLFVLPWNAKAASQIQRLMEKGEGVKAKKRKGRTKDEETPLEFHGEPQPAHPQKQPSAAFQYERGGA